MAAELQISRFPALNAIEQLLHEGYLDGRVGSGTYVRDFNPDHFAKLSPARRQTPPALGRQAGRRPDRDGASPDQQQRPFRVSQPALDRFPYQVFARLVRRCVGNMPLDMVVYGDPAAYLPLRETIAGYLRAARAVDCDVTQIMITSSSPLGLQVCSMALASSGVGTVCLEEPAYPAAQDAFRTAAATVVPVPVDSDGLDVGALRGLGPGVKMAYVTPSHQYPLGVSMDASRRVDLLNWAESNHAWIIEDDYDSEFRYASRPLGALQGMDRSGRVIYQGRFSKVLFPSLRLGYIVVPSGLMQTFTRIREGLDRFSPTFLQRVLTDFLVEGHFARHLRRMRGIYLGRRNALLRAIELHASGLLTTGNTEAGLHLVAFLPGGVGDEAVVHRARERGMLPEPLSTCHAAGAARQGLILLRVSR